MELITGTNLRTKISELKIELLRAIDKEDFLKGYSLCIKLYLLKDELKKEKLLTRAG